MNTDHFLMQLNTKQLAPTQLSALFARLDPIARGLFSLLALILVGILSLAPLFPRHITPATAPATLFSAARALDHLPVIAKEPHPSGSEAQGRVRDYLLQQLTGLGLEPEVQSAPGAENVIARLYGTQPSGAIVLLAHYDSPFKSPGAADNGSGVAVLLETARALVAGPALRNDIIFLFDDGEELPDALTGSKAFVREHPWMEDVRIAISLDTATSGFIATNDTGSQNGWMVQVLDQAFTGGQWSSVSGGGNYDSYPFRQAGVQVLALEDNYPFREKHTADDVPEIVKPGTVQQMGDQTLSLARELGRLDLSHPSGELETYISLPVIGVFHYPQSWTVPLTIFAGVLFLFALGLAFWRREIGWRGSFIALAAMLVTAGLSFGIIQALWNRLPALLGWQTHRWPEWPEIIPPNGELIYVLSGLLVLMLVGFVYGILRRWCGRVESSLAGLLIHLCLVIGLAISAPRGAIILIWPILLSSIAWIVVLSSRKAKDGWRVDLTLLLAAGLFSFMMLQMIIGTFRSDGTKSVAMEMALWAFLLWLILPAVDGLFLLLPSNKKRAISEEKRNPQITQIAADL